MATLFEKAKANSTPTASKAKAEKTEVLIEDVNFNMNLARLATITAEIDTLTAESEILAADVKERGKREYAKLYDSTYKHPGSFILRATAPRQQSASVMFITADRYIKIDEERAEELTTKYGEGIVTEKTTYVMNTALVEKYGDIISNLIEGCKGIPQEDKDKLISAVVALEVKKGTIEDLKAKYAATPVTEVLEDIRPVFSLKNVKID